MDFRLAVFERAMFLDGYDISHSIREKWVRCAYQSLPSLARDDQCRSQSLCGPPSAVATLSRMPTGQQVMVVVFLQCKFGAPFLEKTARRSRVYSQGKPKISLWLELIQSRLNLNICNLYTNRCSGSDG